MFTQSFSNLQLIDFEVNQYQYLNKSTDTIHFYGEYLHNMCAYGKIKLYIFRKASPKHFKS